MKRLQKLAEIDYENIMIEGINELDGDVKITETKESNSYWTGNPSPSDPYSPEEIDYDYYEYTISFDVQADLKPIAKVESERDIQALVNNIQNIIDNMKDINDKLEWLDSFIDHHANTSSMLTSFGSSDEYEELKKDFVITFQITPDAILKVEGAVGDNLYYDPDYEPDWEPDYDDDKY